MRAQLYVAGIALLVLALGAQILTGPALGWAVVGLFGAGLAVTTGEG